MAAFHSEHSKDFESRLTCYLGIILGRQPQHFDQLERDIRNACPEALQHVNELRGHSPEQQVERLDKILDAMQSQEFGRAVAFWHRIGHKLDSMHRALEESGPPMAAITTPDDYISDAALDTYAGELVRKWTIGREYSRLQGAIGDLYLEGNSASPDLNLLEQKRGRAVEVVDEAASRLRALASSGSYADHAEEMNAIADSITREALPLRDGPVTPEAGKNIAAQIGKASNQLMTGPYVAIYGKLVESDAITSYELREKQPDTEVNPGDTPGHPGTLPGKASTEIEPA